MISSKTGTRPCYLRYAKRIVEKRSEWPVSSLTLSEGESSRRYIMVPCELRKEIWKKAGLQFALIKKGTFDYDDFVIKMKEAVTSWARQEYRMNVRDLRSTSKSPPADP